MGQFEFWLCSWKYWICVWLCECVWQTRQQIGKLLKLSSRPTTSISRCQKQANNFQQLLYFYIGSMKSYFRISSAAKWFTFEMQFLEPASTPYNLSLYGRGQEVEEVCQEKFEKIEAPIASHCIALYWWACQKKFGLQLHCQLHAAPLNPRKMRLTLDWHPANIHRSIAHLAHCPVPNGQKNHRNTQETQIHKYTNTQTHKYTNTQTLWIGILQIFTAQLPTLTSAHHKCEKNHRNTKEKHIHKHTNKQILKHFEMVSC